MKYEIKLVGSGTTEDPLKPMHFDAGIPGITYDLLRDVAILDPGEAKKAINAIGGDLAKELMKIVDNAIKKLDSIVEEEIEKPEAEKTVKVIK